MELQNTSGSSASIRDFEFMIGLSVKHDVKMSTETKVKRKKGKS